MQEIQVAEELRDKIQAVDFELTATKDIISYLWNQSPINMEAVEYYTKQQKELFIEFELAKDTLVRMYNLNGKNWNLDYHTSTLTVVEEDLNDC